MEGKLECDHCLLPIHWYIRALVHMELYLHTLNRQIKFPARHQEFVVVDTYKRYLELGCIYSY